MDREEKCERYKDYERMDNGWIKPQPHEGKHKPMTVDKVLNEKPPKLSYWDRRSV